MVLLFGLVLIVVYVLGNLLHSLGTNRAQALEHWHKTKCLFGLLVVTILACLINPLGYEILLFPARLTSDRFVMDRVTEFLSPNFHDVLPFKYMLLATIAALALARNRLNLIEAGLIVLLSYMALYSVRYVSLYAIIVAPLLLKTTESILTDLPSVVLKFIQKRNQHIVHIDTNLRSPHGRSSAFYWLSAQRYEWPSFNFSGNSPGGGQVSSEKYRREGVHQRWFGDALSSPPLHTLAWRSIRHVWRETGSVTLKSLMHNPAEEVPNGTILIGYLRYEFGRSSDLREQTDWQPIYTDKLRSNICQRLSERTPTGE
jgi:hypothetical protein